MNNTSDLNKMLDKLDELRAIFVLGQRAVPFIEDVVHLIRDMSPLLESINGSLQDSANKLPSASSQLESVSQATEMATTEILNLVDLALMKCDDIGKKSETAAGEIAKLQTLGERFEEILEGKSGDDAQALLLDFREYRNAQSAAYDRIAKSMEAQRAAVTIIREGMTQIMLSLQVQDITSQQIASVNHLIHATRERLYTLTENLSIQPTGMARAERDEEPSPPEKLQSGQTYDSNARYALPGLRETIEQELVEDESFESDGDFATMGDIDKLFGNQ